MKKLTESMINEVYAKVQRRWPLPFIQYPVETHNQILDEIYEGLCRATGKEPNQIGPYWGVFRSNSIEMLGPDFPVVRYIEYRDYVGAPAVYYDIFDKYGIDQERLLQMIVLAIKHYGLTPEQKQKAEAYSVH